MKYLDVHFIMNILHVNATQNGGAAICAHRLMEGLGLYGINCKMLSLFENEMYDVSVVKHDSSFLYSNKVLSEIKHLLNRMPFYWDAEKFELEYRKASVGLDITFPVHFPLSEYKNLSKNPLIEWADIIHLHWVSGMIDYPTFFKAIKKPIVWTFHDKHPAVGLLHFSNNNLLPQRLNELNQKCIDIKRRALKHHNNINIVAVSGEMTKLCESSAITKCLPVTLIPNGIDVNSFQPFNKSESRAHWGMLQDASVFMFSSYGLMDTNKGLLRVIEALNNLNIHNKMLVCCGKLNSGEKLPKTKFPILHVGLVTSSKEMASLYSSADFFIQASYEESFGQTPIEAMSCGVPVISTPCGISPELINDFNGVLCNGYTPKDLMKGIIEASKHQYDRTKIRRYVSENFNLIKMTENYISLYNRVLS